MISLSPPSLSGKFYYLQKNPKELRALLGKLFVFAYTWSIGCAFRRTEDADQDTFASRGHQRNTERAVDVGEEFDTFVHDLFDVEPPTGVLLPTSNRLIYAYFVDLESGGFMLWDVLLPSTNSLMERGGGFSMSDAFGGGGGGGKTNNQRSITEELIPTVDTVRYSFLTTLYASCGAPVLLTGKEALGSPSVLSEQPLSRPFSGDTGVGKSAIMHDVLLRLEEEGLANFKPGTVLGSIFNYTDRSAALLDNIHNLTKMDEDEDDLQGTFSSTGAGRAS